MATLTQTPQSVISGGWTANGTSDPACVQSNDGDTTYLSSATQSLSHTHTPGPVIPGEAIDPVNSCGMGVYLKDAGGDTAGVQYGSQSTNIDFPGITTSYALYSGNWPDTPLTKANIDGAGHGTRIQSGGSGTVNQRCTYIYRTIDYTVAAGGFAFLLGVAGLVSGPIGTITDWMHFRNLLRWQSTRKLRNTILTGDEVRLAWREIRECRHPRFFFPRTA